MNGLHEPVSRSEAFLKNSGYPPSWTLRPRILPIDSVGAVQEWLELDVELAVQLNPVILPGKQAKQAPPVFAQLHFV
uniref:Transposase n=1 Tax=Meloidogyne hapla TaxID=6305 RepID=A0A1I8BZM5_MELHA